MKKVCTWLCSLIMVNFSHVYAATVVVPFPLVNVTSNTGADIYGGEHWRGTVTYTATPVDESVLQQLDAMESFSFDQHYRVNRLYDGSHQGSFVTNLPLIEGTSSDHSSIEKLRTINRRVFGQPDPQPGQTAAYPVSHDGLSAKGVGYHECVGIFVAPTSGTHVAPKDINGGWRNVFPINACSDVPPMYGTCRFDLPALTIDLGAGGLGVRKKQVSIAVTCSKSLLAAIGVAPSDGLYAFGNHLEGRGISSTFTFNGIQPGKGMQLPAGKSNVQMEITSTITELGDLSATGTLMVALN